MVFLSELEVCCSTNNPLFWLLVWSFSLLRWQSGAVERFPNVNRSSEAFQKERSTQSGSETKQGIVFFLLGGKGRLSDMSFVGTRWTRECVLEPLAISKGHTMSRLAFSPFTYIACWKHLSPSVKSQGNVFSVRT